MKKLAILVLTTFMASCAEKEPENAEINYSLSVKSSEEFESMSFTFEFTRAHRHAEDANGEIRTVYLDPLDIEAQLDETRNFPLGSSEIEPEPIEGYDFGLTEFTLTKDSSLINLLTPFAYDDFSAAGFEPQPGEVIHVTFILDTDKSVVLDSAGENWILPSIEVVRE